MRRIDKIIVHCTATPEGREVSVKEIDRWHRERGFKCIGYHYVIGLDGKVSEGRPIEEIGAHCTGQNSHSVGVCYVGGIDRFGLPADTRTLQQCVAMRELLASLKERFPKAMIYGHRDFARKACPCFDAAKEYAFIEP
jgi:N-acetylmuramoyl-L-alanine amidase